MIYLFVDDEFFGDMSFELSTEYSIFGGHTQARHLQKRDEISAAGELDPLILQFDSGRRRFVVRLKEHPNIIHESTIVRIHREDKGAIVTRPIYGAAYIGERLVVVDKSLCDSKYGNNATALIDLRNQPGIDVIDDPFGRFYVERNQNKSSIAGGLVYEGSFIRVNDAFHPIGRQISSRQYMKVANPGTEKSPLVITSQSLANAGKFGENMNMTKKYKCGHDHLHFNKSPSGAHSFFAKLLENKVKSGDAIGDNKQRLVARDSGCPLSEKVIYIGIVADCSYLEAFKLDAAQAQANIINDFNIVSSIYEEAFNVNIGILSIDLMMECSSPQSKAAFNRPCSEKMPMDQKLNLFTAWRAGQSADAGIYHLVSGCSDAEIVGIAWLNQVCQVKPYVDSNGDTVAGTSVSVFIKNQFAVMAHEIGHNFGAVHDCDAATCQNCSGDDCQCCPCDNCDCKGRYVMNPESGGLNVKEFSPCALKDVCQKIPVLAPCLKEPGTFKTITKGMCGDGIRDEGEECDCGGPEKCRGNPCCTEDCKLKRGAVCSDNNDRCCKNCQIIPLSANHICIPSKGICQKPSICDGISRDCPKVKYALDGTVCDTEDGKCASGLCTSRSKQCAAVGTRLGLTEDCPYEFGSCSIVCKSSTGSGCVMLDATFINGTPCGYNGKCYSGVCSEPAYQTFILRNIVPLGILGGVLLLIIILIIVRSIMSAYRTSSGNNNI